MRRMAPLAPALAALVVLSASPQARAQGREAPEFPTFYFDLGGYTETWLRMTPVPLPGETASACVLNFTIRYRGKPVEGALAVPPQAILVRAESNPLYNPRIIRHAIFLMAADGWPAWDPNLPLQFFSSGAPCENCAVTADTVEVTVPADTLKLLAAAKTVEGNAMGLPFSLTPAQIAQLRRFVTKVSPPAGN